MAQQRSVLPFSLTQSERQLWEAMLLQPWPITGQASLRQQETLRGPLRESGPEGLHRVSPVTSVFPAQLSAIISLFLWNLLLKAEPKKPLLWETQWVSQKVDRCGEGTERSGISIPTE